MSFAKVYGFEGNPRTRVALVVAKYEGLDVEWVKTNPYAEGGVGAEYLAKFPLGLVPALEKGDYKLTEAIAIASYLASQENKAGLLGQSKEDAADVLRWASWANADLLPTIASWFRPLVGAAPYQKPQVDAAKEKSLKHLNYLEKTLATRTFLVGERITLADIFVASVLFRGFENVLDAEWRQANPNIVRFWQTVYHQPAFFEVLGNVEPTPVEKAVVYTPPKKEAKPKAEPAAPKPKPAAAPKPAAEEEEAPAAPKAKHPCEALGPAQSFPLDEFKRQYSNNDTPVAMKWLDEHYNANDYSISTTTSLPSITGLHTRLEASRKYLFGNMLVYGESNASKIIGIYMIRGNDWKSIFEVAPDYESYEFTMLDYKTDRELIEKVWSWEGEVEGLKCADGKTFK
ncbi:hypothetical protein Rhopal_005720-T1 [Rhodotorula paludigena]|uniref:Elongation factor 1-gamma n=1 Tax=Rhodotorula paludigena TaxID=86838 RepID=A0AAV5GT64_9BASI|nr:hypothetical protein Rhopal_005720-T1 [Rhodotorula paludigena]